MTVSTEVAVMNCILFLRDPSLKNIPEVDRAAAFWANSECIVVCCQPDCFGPTKISLGPSTDIDPAPVLIFDAPLKTPSRRIIVHTVMEETILEHAVSNPVTRVRIWTLGNPDSEIVDIGLD